MLRLKVWCSLENIPEFDTSSSYHLIWPTTQIYVSSFLADPTGSPIESPSQSWQEHPPSKYHRMVSCKDSFRNAFNNRSDHLTDIEDAPDLPSLGIEQLSLSQQLESVEEKMKDAPDVLSLAVERNNLLQRLKTVKEEIENLSKNR